MTHHHTNNRRGLVRRVAAVAFQLVLLSVVALAAMGFAVHARAVPVLTGSMRPHYTPGSLVLTSDVATTDVKVGDVIAFQPPAEFKTPNNRPIMHRVVSLELSNGIPQVHTQGDANVSQDPWTLQLTTRHVQRAAAEVPYVGRLVAAVKSSDVHIAAVSMGGLGLIVGVFILRRRNTLCAECLPPVLAIDVKDDIAVTLLAEPSVTDLTVNRQPGFMDWLMDVTKRSLEADWVMVSRADESSLTYLAVDSGGKLVHNTRITEDFRAHHCWTIGTSGKVSVVNTLQDAACERVEVLASRGLNAYMGVPMLARDGSILGALCVSDTNNRFWHASELDALIELARVGAEYLEATYVAPTTGMRQVLRRIAAFSAVGV